MVWARDSPFLLAQFKPRTLATMHISTFIGDGTKGLKDLAVVMREELSPK